MPRKIHVVINPASGQPQPILHILNRVFRSANVDWDISLTKESGDAEKFASQAVARGVDVVAAYGGDGTVMEVARGVMGSQVPMAILPGGTANLMSVELGIPKDLEKAAQIAASAESKIHYVDVGMVGESYFILRVGLGFAARKVEYADRDLKNRFGIMAYTIAGLKALKDTSFVDYRFVIDGQEIEAKGLTCLVDNAGNMGVSGFSPAREISVSDGLLDILLISDDRFSSFVGLGKTIIEAKPLKEYYFHWQGREINIEANPPQPVQVDGEMIGETPVTIRIKPKAIPILAPRETR